MAHWLPQPQQQFDTYYPSNNNNNNNNLYQQSPHKSLTPHPDDFDQWACSGKGCRAALICIVVSVAMIAICAVATYFCLIHGLKMLDLSFSTLYRFGAGFVIYCGISFSCAAIINTIYLGAKIMFQKSPHFTYTQEEAKAQALLSIFAPVAGVPGMIILGLQSTCKTPEYDAYQ